MKLPDKQNWNFVFIALILALITYAYTNHLVKDVTNSISDPSYKLIKLTAKTVPVKVRFASSPPEGYRLVADRVQVNPPKVTLIGPEALLDETASAETAIIDISQTKRKITKSIPLESVAGIHLSGESQVVEVTIPIEKLEGNI